MGGNKGEERAVGRGMRISITAPFSAQLEPRDDYYRIVCLRPEESCGAHAYPHVMTPVVSCVAAKVSNYGILYACFV